MTSQFNYLPTFPFVYPSPWPGYTSPYFPTFQLDGSLPHLFTASPPPWIPHTSPSFPAYQTQPLAEEQLRLLGIFKSITPIEDTTPKTLATNGSNDVIQPEPKRYRGAKKGLSNLSYATLQLVTSFLGAQGASSLAQTSRFYKLNTEQYRKRERLWLQLKKAIYLENPTVFKELLTALHNTPGLGSPRELQKVKNELLIDCANAKNLPCLKALLDAGADITVTCLSAHNILHWAMQHTHQKEEECVAFFTELLRLIPPSEIGHLVYGQNSEGQTPLMEAALYFTNAFVTQLLPYTPHLTIRNNLGQNLAHLLAIGGHPHILRTFLDGLSPEIRKELTNEKDKYGHVPLMSSVDHDRPHCVRVLLEEPFDLLTVCENDYSLYERSIILVNPEISNILLAKEARLAGALAIKKFVHAFSLNSIRGIDPQFFNGSTPTVMGKEFNHLLRLDEVRAYLRKSITVKNYNILLGAFNKYHIRKIDVDENVREIRAKKLVVLQAGWKAHAVSLIFCNNYMVICNRGEAPAWVIKENPSSYFVKKIDCVRFKREHLDKIISLDAQDMEVAALYFYKELPRLLNAKETPSCAELRAIAPKLSKADNCSYSAVKGAFRAATAFVTKKPKLAKKCSKVVATLHRENVLDALKHTSSACPEQADRLIEIGEELLQARKLKHPDHIPAPSTL